MDDLLAKATAYRQLAIHEDNAHYAMAQAFERRHKLLGVPVVMTTTAVWEPVATSRSRS